MSQLDERVRHTDVLDAAGNTAAVIEERLCGWFCDSGESRAVRSFLRVG